MDKSSQHHIFNYSRTGNPTRDVLEKCLASLDNGKYGLTFGSGTATATTITQLLSAGDHLITSTDVYWGINCVFSKVTARMGVEISFVDTSLENVKNAIKKNTKLIWLETPTNPCMNVHDIRAISQLAHSMGDIIVAVDNTFLTSYFQRPLELGADIVAYSATKFLNGHSDVTMGALVVNDDSLYERLKLLQEISGAIPSPFDCYQVNRSLKTLKIRMEQHMKNSMQVAEFLEAHTQVERVLHPGLKSHPQHELVLRQTYGHSGIMSFYLKGGLEESKKFLMALKIITIAESLGGYGSEAQLPSIMTFTAAPPKVVRHQRFINSSFGGLGRHRRSY